MGICSSHGKRDEETDDEEDEKPTLATIPHTVVPSEMFATPVPVSMSGGTAQFFNLNYAGPASGPAKDRYGKSPTYWLGKDVERALDELPFYETLLKQNLNNYKLLRDWTMSYVGIFTEQVAKKRDNPKVLEEKARNLLVIHDIADGLVKKRMLDIKIGEETAVANWRGKSARSAAMQSLVDKATNSVVEGYRLEGFDNKPESLATQDRGDTGGLISKCSLVHKKTNRVQLQIMPFRDFGRYWHDMNDMADLATNSSLTPAENSEAVLFDAIRQIGQMSVDMRKMPAAQTWIGSSICLACDCGKLLERQSTLQRLARPRPDGPSMQSADLAKVCIFDWGRSELNTVEANAALTSKDQLMRKKYWDIYQRGILRTFFEATSLYITQFCQKPDGLQVEAWDFDTFDPNDLLGSVDVDLAATDGLSEFELDTKGSVSMEVSEVRVPQPSRLQKIWHVYVDSVTGLSKSDLFSDTDPVVRVKFGSLDGCMAYSDTPVEWDDRDAWIEYGMYFGVATPEAQNSLISGMSVMFGKQMSLNMFQFTPDEVNNERARQAKFEAFLQAVPMFADLAHVGI